MNCFTDKESPIESQKRQSQKESVEDQRGKKELKKVRFLGKTFERQGQLQSSKTSSRYWNVNRKTFWLKKYHGKY